MTRVRRAVFRGAAVGSGVLVALAGAELAARHVDGLPATELLVNSPNWYDSSIFEPDAELVQVLRPGAVGHMRTPEFDTEVAIGALGTRGEVAAKPSGGLRVLAVGDSFTLAVQVPPEDTFCARLGQALTTRLRRPVEVVDAGVDGYGTYAEVTYARRVVARMQDAGVGGVDAVLVTWFLGNDFRDNRERRPGSADLARAVVAAPPLLTSTDRAFAWSAIYFHYVAVRNARALARDPARAGRALQEFAPFVEGEALRLEEPDTRAAFGELERLHHELGVPVVVAFAPPAFVLSEARARATFALYGIHGEPAVDAPARFVAGMVPRDLLAVDLTPALRAGEAAGHTYYTFDGHWRAHGHQVVAEALTPTFVAALGAAEPR